MNGYTLHRRWFNWNFENFRKARPIHGILYMWCVEKSNRLGWMQEFQLPSDEAAAACGAADRETIIKALADLQSWGFIEVTQEARNRYTARWIKILDPEFTLSGNLDSAVLLHPKKSDAKKVDTEEIGCNSDAILVATTGAIPVATPTNIKQQTTNNKTIKRKKPDLQNPDPKGDFIDSVISIFCEEFKQARSFDYVVTNKGKERAGAGNILTAYKQKYPELDSAETLEGLRANFQLYLNIRDKWHFSKMSLSHIASSINELNIIANNGGTTEGVTDAELARIVARNFGKKGKGTDLTDYKRRIISDLANMDFTTTLNDVKK